MASILSKVKVLWLEHQIKKNQTKLEFNKNFLPIKIQNFTDKKEFKFNNLELKKKTEILPLEIKAGIESEYLKENYEAEKALVEDKFYWEKRALVQTLKRLEETDETAIQELHEKKQQELEAVKGKYYLKDYKEEDIENYKNLKTTIETNFESKVKSLEDVFSNRIKKFTERIEGKMKKYQNKLDRATAELEKIDIKPVYDLDEKILLKLDNLSMHFGGLKAVDQLSFEVKEGEIFGLIGPNGAGKTTVFNCITKFYKPTAGDLYFRNRLNDVVHLNEIVVHNIIKEGIARTFQNVEMIWELNVIENLLIAAHTNYRSGFFGHLFNSRLLKQEEIVIRKKAEKILNDLDLLEYAYQYPLGLPYGILKKIELARTLMINPRLIILDEPAAGLNDTETDELAKVIKKIREEYNATIFLVEHDMGLVMDICDTVCAISFGHKLAIGTPKEIQNNKVVREAYLGGE